MSKRGWNHDTKPPQFSKGLEINNSLELAHRFRADSESCKLAYLVDPIEQNRERSCTTFRISESHKLAYLRLRIGQRWSEAGMQKR